MYQKKLKFISLYSVEIVFQIFNLSLKIIQAFSEILVYEIVLKFLHPVLPSNQIPLPLYRRFPNVL